MSERESDGATGVRATRLDPARSERSISVKTSNNNVHQQ
jgi:hypothetical protein